MTKFAEFVISMCDNRIATEQHIDTVRLTIPATVATTSNAISEVNVYKFWEVDATSTILKRHPAAIWTKLSMRMAQGPGLFGRAVTLHYGWGHEDMSKPITVSEMSRLFGYQCHVFGGVFSLTDDQVTIGAPFNSARSDVAKVNQHTVGGRIVMFYFFEEEVIGTTQGAGPRISFRFDGEFDVYDRN